MAAALVVIDEEHARWEFLIALVLDSLPSIGSKRKYGAALREFWGWWRPQLPRPVFSKATVQAFRVELESRGLSGSTINIRLSALRKLASEAADNGLLPADLAAGIGRVKGCKRLGVRMGNWLGRTEANRLLNTPAADTLKGKRDRAILAVLLGCALRRAELASLMLEHVQQRDGRWVIVDLSGKGGRIRTVPMPAWVKSAIDDWVKSAGLTSGSVFRAINRGGRAWGSGFSEKVVWQALRKYADAAGFPNFAPHDCRRSCAKLCRDAGGELEQIQFLLGHASITTTERYLGSKQNLSDAPNDHLGLKLLAPKGE
jgi:site-specific recombinase XerC